MNLRTYKSTNIPHLTTVGSAALDTIETPFGRVEMVVGGSVFYIGASAALFAPVHLVSVVGDDFPMAELDFLRRRGVNLDDLSVKHGETFRWEGRYHTDMNRRDTICTHLGVSEGYHPKISPVAAEAPFVLLANIDPELQLEVLEAMKRPRFVAFDTMNLWIRTQRELVDILIRKSDLVIINDEELALLTGGSQLVDSARKLAKKGPRYVVVKKGEHGAIMFSRDEPPFLCPAYPLSGAKDPTGAGDSFAGAMVGYLAASGEVSPLNLRQAVVFGVVTASFTVEDFGLNRLRSLTLDDIEARMREFRAMLEF
jgi:sugar/nucleoside kinase (ribokinase family)